MADATEKSRFGDMTTYKTAGKPADVATFYKDRTGGGRLAAGR